MLEDFKILSKDGKLTVTGKCYMCGTEVTTAPDKLIFRAGDYTLQCAAPCKLDIDKWQG